MRFRDIVTKNGESNGEEKKENGTETGCVRSIKLKGFAMLLLMFGGPYKKD